MWVGVWSVGWEGVWCVSKGVVAVCAWSGQTNTRNYCIVQSEKERGKENKCKQRTSQKIDKVGAELREESPVNSSGRCPGSFEKQAFCDPFLVMQRDAELNRECQFGIFIPFGLQGQRERTAVAKCVKGEPARTRLKAHCCCRSISRTPSTQKTHRHKG